MIIHHRLLRGYTLKTLLPVCRRLLLVFSLTLSSTFTMAENEIGFIETFALSENREATLQQLIPGTEDAYFYAALHWQNAGNAAKYREVMEQWAKRYPGSNGRKTLENRQALLDYDRNPANTVEYLKRVLNPALNHTADIRGRSPELPSKLDPARISRAVFQERALRGDQVAECKIDMLEAFLREKTPLKPSQLRDLLSRIHRPDVDGLVGAIITELRMQDSKGFGGFDVHTQLLPAQLDELEKALPHVAHERDFVMARLAKLNPGSDEDPQFDRASRQAWLTRVWDYVSKLPAAYDGLKIVILRSRLEFDLQEGKISKPHFIAYLRLPRSSEYINRRYMESARNRGTLAEPDAGFEEFGDLFSFPGDDAALVRSLFLELFREEDSWEPYAEWVNDAWLKPIFAEAKIVNGLGNAEKWASLLSPAAFAALKDRVDIDFSPLNPVFTAIGDEVKLGLFVKNVPKLLVKIYELNTLGYYLSESRELNTDLPLDGLVANHERTEAIEASPFLRKTISLAFPELTGRRGAWMIELIGSGKSSRALIRKGAFSVLTHVGAAGDELTVLDENRAPVADAVAWVDGRRLVPHAKTGRILVPFTASPGSKSIVISDAKGEAASLVEIEQHDESYTLDVQFHLEREQLIAGKEAVLGMRAALLLHQTLVPLELLKEVNLRMVTTSLDGVETSREFKDLKLEAAKLTTNPFRVPPRTRRIQAFLTAKIKQFTKGDEEQQLDASDTWEINGVDESTVVESGHLLKSDAGYSFDLLGRNGEPIADKVVNFEISHGLFESHLSLSLKTDANGRIALGTLEGISQVKAVSPTGMNAHWTLTSSGETTTSIVHIAEGAAARLPFPQRATEWARMLRAPAKAAGLPAGVSLLEERNGAFLMPESATVRAEDGLLEISGLKAGSYSLRFAGVEEEISIQVTRGESRVGWLVGPNRLLELGAPPPVTIGNATVADNKLRIPVKNGHRFTRVHVAASRYLPDRDLFRSLADFNRFGPATAMPAKLNNIYVAGRKLGDEFRYILDRRFARIYPGVMLPRPSLILNPWELRDTSVAPQGLSASAAAKAGYAGRGGAARESLSMLSPAHEEISGTGVTLDFLDTTAQVVWNLVPDADGFVTLDLAALGDRQYIQIYADDLANAAWRTVALPERPIALRDLRLATGLDATQHFAQKRESTMVAPGTTLTLPEALSSEWETLDSLSAIHSLFVTLTSNPTLTEFAFLSRWDQLPAEEKRTLYSKYACHELHFFLSRKDPAFFKDIVQPYLQNKKDKRFMDHFLLESDLSGYLKPWAYNTLNAAEKALLGLRLPGERGAGARYLQEMWELIPPNPEKERRLFETVFFKRGMEESENMFGTVSGGGAQSQILRSQAFGNASAPASPAPMSPAIVAAPAPALPASRKAVKRMDERKNESDFDDKPDMRRSKGKKQDMAEVADMLLADPVDGYLAADLDGALQSELRKDVRLSFRALGTAKEWAENQYYKTPLAKQDGSLIPPNAFWRDYADWIRAGAKGPFLSGHIAEATSCFAEMILAMSVLDLPFTAGKPTVRTEGQALTLTAATPLMVFHQQTRPLPMQAGPQLVLLSQNMYKVGERHKMDGNDKVDNYITGEFEAGQAYGCVVVVTNPTSSIQKTDLLIQIPTGALPLQKTRTTGSNSVWLDPYSTKTVEYFFYFPHPADAAFPQFPAHLSRGDHTLAAAAASTFQVVRTLSTGDKNSWEYISQNATDAEVLAYLAKANIQRLNLERIAWRARASATFFHELIGLLTERHTWSEPIYRYALAHRHTEALREWLAFRTDFVGQCGPIFRSSLLTIDPEERRSYEHLEYDPLVNQRAHPIGRERKIDNAALRGQYQRLLRILAHEPALDAMDRMAVAYYLFVQDRNEEALAHLAKVKPEALPGRLQYDYLALYAAFLEADLPKARQLAAQYAGHPVERWRSRFAEARIQLDELAGHGTKRDAKEDREQQQGELAATEPSFELKVENRQVQLSWRNLSEVKVNYYLMDPEFLFSSQPFVSERKAGFTAVKPTKSVLQALPARIDHLTLELPGEFQRANVLVEVVGAGQRQTQPYHANGLRLSIAAPYGRLEVLERESGKALPKTYVKVYAQLGNGTVRFYKDGYTDLRGKFDYASLNDSAGGPTPRRQAAAAEPGSMDHQMLQPSELKAVQKLAILVLSESHGAEVREVAPPTR